MTTNQTIDGVPRRAVEWAFERLEICQDQAFQTCECEECEQCGKMPDECSGTDCAKTCQCSTCDHCSNELAMSELRALLDAPAAKNWEYFHNAMESERDYWKAQAQKPAAQPQGEPVAWTEFDALDFMTVALRHAEYSGLASSDILDGLRYMAEKGRPAFQPAPVAVASRDESIYWLKRIDGIGQARAELIYSMGFRRHTEVPQS